MAKATKEKTLTNAIPKKNEGKFADWAKERDMTTKKATTTVLRNPEKYTPHERKMAQYAANTMGINPGIKPKFKKEIKKIEAIQRRKKENGKRK